MDPDTHAGAFEFMMHNYRAYGDGDIDSDEDAHYGGYGDEEEYYEGYGDNVFFGAYGGYDSDGSESWDMTQVTFYRPDGDEETKDVQWCLDNDFFQVEEGLWSGEWYYKTHPGEKSMHNERLRLTQQIKQRGAQRRARVHAKRECRRPMEEQQEAALMDVLIRDIAMLSGLIPEEVVRQYTQENISGDQNSSSMFPPPSTSNQAQFSPSSPPFSSSLYAVSSPQEPPKELSAAEIEKRRKKNAKKRAKQKAKKAAERAPAAENRSEDLSTID